MKKQRRPHLSERAYDLAERLDPSGNRTRAVEVALEVVATLRGYHAGTSPFPYGHGKFSSEAADIVHAVFAAERDRLFERAIERATVTALRMLRAGVVEDEEEEG